ncbi:MULTISPECIES: hypothetical protein [Haloarcula]|uniref:hypothetical protein n=1 Tax=Haloarcula TaxID=2237 RepID=UPI0023E8678A|nr:hypothetical protein [Halomicroarcula sp. SHR3]
MSDFLCVLSTDVQDRIESIGDGSLQDGAVKLLKHWDSRPTEKQEQAAHEQEIKQKQAELREQLTDR